MSNMRKRRYELPGINELSKEQEAVNYLNREGKHLIVGGPGTGKSVVALLRTRLLAADKQDYLFLVYNVLLEQASKQLYPGLKSARWISWFNSIYKNLFGKFPPKRSTDYADIEWNQAIKRILDNDVLPLQSKYLVMDEGQDMPPGFYEALMALGAENFFVAADQNQQITEYNANLKQLRETLDIDQDKVIKLKENFRQKNKGYHVALLADAFYPDDPGTARPEPPQKTSAETPLLYTYTHEKFDVLIERIIKIVERNPKELIGIIVPKDDTRKKYFNGLNKVMDRLQNVVGDINISTYYSGIDPRELKKIRFDQGGIMVINSQSCKGLEFDTVFIADINDFYFDQGSDATKRIFYVMVARARERVFLLCEAEKDCPVEKILPNDKTILQRK